MDQIQRNLKSYYCPHPESGNPFEWPMFRTSLNCRMIGSLAVLLLLGLRLQAAAPKVAAISPLGGQRGTTVEVELRGSGLDGVHTVWLGPGSQLASAKVPFANIRYTKGPNGLDAHVAAVPDGSRAKVRFVLAADARVGFHAISLISPGGLSESIPFWVGPDAVIQEAVAPHYTPETAQPVTVPVAINGQIAGGQVNYYALDVGREQNVAFELISLVGPNAEAHLALEPQLALYQAGGSFLDPGRAKRLLFREEITQGSMPANRRMTYHFTQPGRYLVSFGNRLARGGAGHSYLLRLSLAEAQPVADDALSWAQRRLREIRSRAIDAPSAEVSLVKEAEPNDEAGQAKAFAPPAVLEGTIGRPGDIDHFRFRAKPGQNIAFEIQTPDARPPHFNPRLDILNAKGSVVLSNMRVEDGKIGTEPGKVIQLAPEVQGKLDDDGEYTLRIRDVTSIHGSDDHKYRVLVRPQIQHFGPVRIEPAGPVNLVCGGKRRLLVSAPGKEKNSGVLALSIEGLPAGVRAFVSAANSTIELVADADAPRSPMPQVVRIWGLPVLGEKSGSAFLVAEVPVMLVQK
jgi:hypothetical protein